MRYILVKIVFVCLLGVCFSCNNKPGDNTGNFQRIHFSPAGKAIKELCAWVAEKDTFHLFSEIKQPEDDARKQFLHIISADMLHWKTRGICSFETEPNTIVHTISVVEKRSAESPMKALLLVEKNDSTYFVLGNSTDSGQHWIPEKTAVNFPDKLYSVYQPVLVYDVNNQDWVMCITLPSEVRFYTSSDLVSWTQAPSFVTNNKRNSPNYWHKAMLVPFTKQGKWALLIEQNQIDTNQPANPVYFVGNFGAAGFVASSDKSHWLDYGTSMQSMISLSSQSQVPVMLGVVDNGKGKNRLTSPRTINIESFFDNELLAFNHTESVDAVFKENSKIGTQDIKGRFVITDHISQNETPLEILLEFRTDDMTRISFPSPFGVNIETKKYEQASIGYDVFKRWYFVNCQKPGSQKILKQLMPCYHNSPVLKMRLIIDNGLVELFTGGGKLVMTQQLPLSAPVCRISVFANNGIIRLNKAIILSVNTNDR